jgi:pentatricopeptide repeat-containing protein PET309
MQRLHLAEKDGEALVQLIERVTKAGFELDSKNWNYHVQALARLRMWKEAFFVCEEKLMPQWAGWYRLRVRQNVKNQIPLELRRLGSGPRYLRPTSHTLLILAKAYADLEQMAPWSAEADKLVNILHEECARVVRAITTMVRSGSDLETEIFSGRRHDGKAQHEDHNPNVNGTQDSDDAAVLEGLEAREGLKEDREQTGKDTVE